MKKSLITLLSLATAVGAFAQGSVDFRNRNTTVTPTLDAPIVDTDGITKIAGSGFVAQLFYSTTQSGSFTAITDPAAPFRTGAGAGYWDYGTDFTRIVPTIAPGAQAWIQVRVWDASAADYASAIAAGMKYGSSGAFQITLGGAGNPPSVPAALVGLTGFSLQQVPEPSTIALGVLGGLALLLRRRK